jgi:hypothetical protein
MARNESIDGIPIERMRKMIDEIPGTLVTRCNRGSHLYTIEHPDMGERRCQLVVNGSARRFVVPWLSDLLDESAGKVFGYLKKGKWPRDYYNGDGQIEL